MTTIPTPPGPQNPDPSQPGGQPGANAPSAPQPGPPQQPNQGQQPGYPPPGQQPGGPYGQPPAGQPSGQPSAGQPHSQPSAGQAHGQPHGAPSQPWGQQNQPTQQWGQPAAGQGQPGQGHPGQGQPGQGQHGQGQPSYGWQQPEKSYSDANPLRAAFDFSFNSYATPGLVKIIYILAVAVGALIWLGGTIVYFIVGIAAQDAGGGSFPIIGAVLQLIFGWIPVLLYLLLIRVVLEAGMALVRAAEDVRALRSNSDA
jgi:hypothetical protein